MSLAGALLSGCDEVGPRLWHVRADLFEDIAPVEEHAAIDEPRHRHQFPADGAAGHDAREISLHLTSIEVFAQGQREAVCGELGDLHDVEGEDVGPTLLRLQPLHEIRVKRDRVGSRRQLQVGRVHGLLRAVVGFQQLIDRLFAEERRACEHDLGGRSGRECGPRKRSKGRGGSQRPRSLQDVAPADAGFLAGHRSSPIIPSAAASS